VTSRNPPLAGPEQAPDFFKSSFFFLPPRVNKDSLLIENAFIVLKGVALETLDASPLLEGRRSRWRRRCLNVHDDHSPPRFILKFIFAKGMFMHPEGGSGMA